MTLDHIDDAGLEEDISICLWNLQLTAAKLALECPELPERHRNLIDDVLHTVGRWGDPTLEAMQRRFRADWGLRQ